MKRFNGLRFMLGLHSPDFLVIRKNVEKKPSAESGGSRLSRKEPTLPPEAP
jgi:hypothetical protein